MSADLGAFHLLDHEARALLSRLQRIKPFALQETMVPAAAISHEAQGAIDQFLIKGRRELRDQVRAFLRWLRGPDARRLGAAEAQRRFSLLRLRFVSTLDHFDIFADVLTQRSEAETGVWLSGLDEVAADALRLRGIYYQVPPVICYLDRGHGAAIRRARSRLPGGGDSPVAVIRVPRERMIGSGIASSLFHEVGHQGASQLGLVESLRPILHGLQRSGGRNERFIWTCWERWISEIVSDLWAVARLGITATMGLIGVVSLPRFFVFRLTLDDPHPPPWLRVLVSAAIGQALYPDPQWAVVTRIWRSFYPDRGTNQEFREQFALLERSIPGLVALLINHRPPALRGRSLKEVLVTAMLQPARLRAAFQASRTRPGQLSTLAPSLALAVVGQARADGAIGAEAEGRLLGTLLTTWALQSAAGRSVTGASIRARSPVAAGLRLASPIS